MKKIFYLTALAVMVLASCGKENGGDNVLDQEGVKAGLAIKMAFPSTRVATYANEDATDEELTVEDVDVFIFDAGDNSLVTHRHLTKADFDVDVTKKIYITKNTSKVVTTTGNRKVAIGVNLPASIVATVNTVRSIDAVNDQTVHDVTVADIATADRFAMFNVDMDQVIVVKPGDDPDNTVSLNVERLAGKAALATIEDFDFDTDGNSSISSLVSLGTLDYRLMQTNTQSYLMRDPAGKDPNYLSGDFFPGQSVTFPQYNETVFESAADYKAVDGYLIDNSTRPAFYGAENTSDFYALGSNTYFLVRAQFTPKVISDGTGNSTGAGVTGATFWIVTNGTDTYFCGDQADADALAADPSVFPDGDATASERVEGYCYWGVWIGNKNDHDFLRNNYYLGQIKGFNGFGEKTPEEVIVPPDSPVDGEVKATLECEFTILDWTFKLADSVELN
jgi:hypothetical protein